MKYKSAAKKVYIQPGTLVYDIMHNIMNLQKGSEIFSDETTGKLHYTMTMDNLSWTLRFSVLEMDFARCAVTLEIEEEMDPQEMDGEETRYLENMIQKQFALLDSMLLNSRPFCVTYGERRCV